MNSFPVHTIDTAPTDSRPILEGVQKSVGFVPNLFGAMASSPALFEGYQTLAGILDQKADFTETERQVLFMSISRRNGCEYCVSAHSTISGMKKVSADVVEALREGTTLPDAKLEALRSFALGVIEKRGFMDAGDLDAFLSAGYEHRHALEVVLAVAYKTMSNFTNHLVGTELDEPFQSTAWTANVAAV